MQQSVKQMLFFLLLAIIFFLIFSGLFMTRASGASSGNWVPNSTLIKKAGQQLNQFDRDVTIGAYEKLAGDVLVTNGDLTVEGEIYGDVIVFYGNVVLKDDAIIYGHVTVYEGEIFNDDRAQIAGDLLVIYGKRTKYTQRRDIGGINKKITRFNRKSTVRKNENIDGNMVVLNGDVKIEGEINGDVIALDGDVRIRPRALVIGHVITPKGTTIISKGGRCTGQVVALNLVAGPKSVEWKNDSQNWSTNEEEIRESVERKYLNSGDEGIFRFFGDVTVNPNELIEGNIVVMKGKVDLQGEVAGDVVAIFGDIQIGSKCYVDGDVVSVGGKIIREAGATVTGDVVETSLTGAKVTHPSADQYRKKSRTKRVNIRGNEWQRFPRPRYPNMEEKDPLKFRYNRVEGLFLGLQMPHDYWWNDSPYHVALFGHVGYGFSNKEMRYRVGLERWFFDDLRLTLGGQIYDLTETQDEWLIPDLENSMAALFIKEDFQDFYERKGFSGHVKQNLTPSIQLSAEYRIDQFLNMEQSTQWAVFGGHKKFFPNPAIDPFEELKSVVARVEIDTRNNRRHPSQGWYISFEGQFAGERLQNEEILPQTNEVVDFDRYILDLRRYQPIGYGENLDIRLRAGSARGVLPQQFAFDMGGLSSLRGYDYKYFKNGDRLLLANLEYRIHGRRASFHDLWLFEHFNLILFADAGLVWNSENKLSYQEGFSHLTWSDLKTDVGIAITNHEGDVRVNFAKRTDVAGQPIVITFRLNRAF